MAPHDVAAMPRRGPGSGEPEETVGQAIGPTGVGSGRRSGASSKPPPRRAVRRGSVGRGPLRLLSCVAMDASLLQPVRTRGRPTERPGEMANDGEVREVNAALWAVQILLALFFLMAGGLKLVRPKEKLVTNMEWARDFTQEQIRVIGTLEVLGAVGVILPMLTGIFGWLTPVAAVGLTLTMVGAVLTHLRLGEHRNIIVPAVLLVLAAFVAFGRFVAVPA